MQHTETLSANAVHSYAVQCLDSGEVDIVKLGLILTELFVEKDENVKDKIRTLGLSDEFTIFCVFNMLNWENGNDEVFRLAQKVHGWGRIHAVERLDPVNSEIKEWLLREGIDNRVMSEYSAPDVYEKADIGVLQTKPPLDCLTGFWHNNPNRTNRYTILICCLTYHKVRFHWVIWT